MIWAILGVTVLIFLAGLVGCWMGYQVLQASHRVEEVYLVRGVEYCVRHDGIFVEGVHDKECDQFPADYEQGEVTDCEPVDIFHYDPGGHWVEGESFTFRHVRPDDSEVDG